jgi:hypothetical protein
MIQAAKPAAIVAEQAVKAKVPQSHQFKSLRRFPRRLSSSHKEAMLKAGKVRSVATGTRRRYRQRIVAAVRSSKMTSPQND